MAASIMAGGNLAVPVNTNAHLQVAARPSYFSIYGRKEHQHELDLRVLTD